MKFLSIQRFLKFLSRILSYGPLDVLTNGTQITAEKAQQLRKIQDASDHPLRFRVSMENFEEVANDAIRGKNAYRKAVTGISHLAQAGFSPILTITRSWDEEQGQQKWNCSSSNFYAGINRT